LSRADPLTYEPQLGRALYERCMAMTAARSVQSYMELLDEGIALHRKLAYRQPISVPQLGIMLCWMGYAQYTAGRHEQARPFLEEGLGLIRALAREQVDLFDPKLAHALALTSFALQRAGDHRGALSTARESVAIWRQLTDLEPSAHDSELSGALHTLCFALQAAGKAKETSRYAEESVAISRQLLARDPSASNARLLANGLDLKAVALVNHNRLEDALTVQQEAVRHYQEAGRERRKRGSANYASSLLNATKLLSMLERPGEAKAYAQRSATECVRRTRDAESPTELAAVASELAGLMNDLGMTWMSETFVKAMNQRLSGQPRGLARLFRRR
jgi:tetratricopeptide (TPR) repeat protein